MLSNREIQQSEPYNKSPHTFHIPVMGTGFTIDTPIKVARYGISSVISLGDDNLIEKMRRYYCDQTGESYTEIKLGEEDWRARRITAYLNLLSRIINMQVEDLRKSPFEQGSEITRYYELLPESELKSKYLEMKQSHNLDEITQLQEYLRSQAVPGSIDVNIMCSADRPLYRNGTELSPEYSLACSALRGYANSDLNSSLVLSAGLNQRLYKYISKFDCFYPDINGKLPKQIVIKVSDFRSASIQSKFLAKFGLWVSEFRVESGVNCGGHAFASKGQLLGPILSEFIERKPELSRRLKATISRVLQDRKFDRSTFPSEIVISVQGGIGTSDENDIFLKLFKVDKTGWGTPFLMVPEVVNIDEEHLNRLSIADDMDVKLGENSPFGIPFWSLRTSASEETRTRRIKDGKPGSPCAQGYLKGNTEFTEKPICVASRLYQRLKLAKLDKEGHSFNLLKSLKEAVISKACICCDLAGSAEIVKRLTSGSKPAVCCGPNIVNFSKIASLDEIVSHIYGRLSLLTNPDRPHIFLKEASLYFDYLKREFDKFASGLSNQKPVYFKEFKENLLNGIDYYLQLADKHVVDKLQEQYGRDIKAMCQLRDRIESFSLVPRSKLSIGTT